MRDVAALAGVSLKTVSRVVNGEAGRLAATSRPGRARRRPARLPPQPRRQQPAAGQRPHRHGRGAPAGRQQQLLRQPAARPRGRRPRPRRGGPRREPRRGARTRAGAGRAAWCAAGSTASCSCPPAERQDYLADELRSGLPVVFVDRAPNGVDADSVTVDNRAVALPRRSSHLHRPGPPAHRLPRRPGDHPDRRRAGCAASARPTPRPACSLDPRLEVTGLRRPRRRRVRRSPPCSPSPSRPPRCSPRGTPSPWGRFSALRRPRPSTRDRAGRLRRLPAGRRPRPAADRHAPERRARSAQRWRGCCSPASTATNAPPAHLVLEPLLVVRGSGEIRPSVLR